MHLFFLLVGCSHPVPTAATQPCNLPADWDPIRIAHATPELYNALLQASEVRVLAWLIEEDSRPLRVDRALMWIHYENLWFLSNLYRHPLYADDRDWHLNTVTDVVYQGKISFSHPPTQADLNAFLRATWWDFKPDNGFWFLAAQVCTDNWTATFQEAPWRSFPVGTPH